MKILFGESLFTKVIGLCTCLILFVQARPSEIQISQSVSTETPPDATSSINIQRPDDQTLEDRHPFLRHQRDANCPPPTNLPKLVSDLNPYLNTSTFIGIVSGEANSAAVPADQPSSCPVKHDTWWPGVKHNLRSTCPWIYEEVDFGEEFYPRKFLEAKCLCTTCVNANAMNCEKLRHPVTVFRRVGCKDGIAVLEKQERRITVGCYCASAAVQPGTPPSYTETP